MFRKEKSFVKYLEKLINKYSPLLGVDSYWIVVDPKKSIFDDPKVGFQIDILYPYKRAFLYWSERALNKYKEGNFKQLEQAVIHELCHIPVEGLKRIVQERYINKREVKEKTETLVDHFANVFFKLLNKD